MMYPGRILRIAAAAFIALLLGPGNVLAKQDAGDLSMSEKAYVASKIYSSLQLYFAHWRGIPNFDLDSEYKSYLSRALNTNSRFDFDLATWSLLLVCTTGILISSTSGWRRTTVSRSGLVSRRFAGSGSSPGAAVTA